MASTSFVIPYYNGDEYRLRNLLKVLDFYIEHSSEDAEVILCEQLSSVPSDVLARYKKSPKFKYLKQRVSWTRFNKSSCWNHAVKHAKGTYIVGVDADIITHPNLVKSEYIASYMEANGFRLVYPFDSIVDLSDDETSMYVEDHSYLATLNVEAHKNRLRQGTRCYGGIWFMRRTDYVAIGGYNESFRSWGGEDDMFAWVSVAMFTMEKYNRVPTHCFHLWHPVSNTRDYLMSEDYKMVVALKQKIMTHYYDTNTAPAYCKTQKTINGLS